MFRFLIYSSIIILVCSCGNESQQKKEDIVDSFKRVSENLEKTKTNISLNINTSAIYDSLRRKLAGTDELSGFMQMKLAIQDFYVYIADLRKEFYIFCGDKQGSKIPAGIEGEANYTNQFFLEQGYADNLFPLMKAVKDNLPPRLTPQEDMIGLINSLKPGEDSKEPVDDFLNAYFKNVPPLAAATILNTFELKVRNIEHDLLLTYVELYKVEEFSKEPDLETEKILLDLIDHK